MNVITPTEFIAMQSPDVNLILQKINHHMESTGDCSMTLSLAGIKSTAGFISAVKRKLVDAGWIVRTLEIRCDDRPCAEPYLEVSLDIPKESDRR